MAATPAFAADQPAGPWLSPLAENAANAAPPPAFGEEFDMLRGSRSVGQPNFMNWRGFYVGGQFSYSAASADFSSSTKAPIAYSLRDLTLENEAAPSNWPVLGRANHGVSGFGGFAGYNFEYVTPDWKVVLGVEANYTQASLSLIAPNSPISRIVPAGGNSYLVNITGSGSVTNLDFGTLRARAGWAFGNFLPYGFAGVAIGRANVNIAETTSGQQNPPTSGTCDASPSCTPFSFSGTAGKDSEWLYGLTVGAGLDVAVTQNIFLRAEYEYVQFQSVAATVVEINTVRAGAGIKF
jgi:outer membrane immunogenic protein